MTRSLQYLIEADALRTAHRSLLPLTAHPLAASRFALCSANPRFEIRNPKSKAAHCSLFRGLCLFSVIRHIDTEKNQALKSNMIRLGVKQDRRIAGLTLIFDFHSLAHVIYSPPKILCGIRLRNRL
jgi:hypothetical protein